MTNRGKRAIFAILFLVEARPGQRRHLVEFLKWDRKESIERELGTLCFDVFRDTANPDRFYVYEAYEDRAAFKEHQKHKPYKKWRSKAFQKEIVFRSTDLRPLAP